MSLSLVEQNYICCLLVKMSLTDTLIHDISENRNNSKYFSLVEQTYGRNNNHHGLPPCNKLVIFFLKEETITCKNIYFA